MKKKKSWIAALMGILLVACLLSWNARMGYSGVLKANWGVSLPFKALCAERYEKNSGSSFHGDGLRYHVFSYEYEDYIDLMFVWRVREDATIFHDSYTEAAEHWLEELEVPDAWRPDYGACCYRYRSKPDNSELLMFWDQEANYLYILESFL